jgi:hemolysin type calcium-binding protein
MGGPANVSLTRAVPVVLLFALALIAPAAAQAKATLSVTGAAPHEVLTFTADDALSHHVGVTAGDHLVLDDPVGIAVGASGCTPIDAHTADCGPATAFERVAFAFGSGDDRLVAYGSFTIAIAADGGAGHDVLEAGAGRDRLSGGAGDDDLWAGSGDDELVGGDGDDHLDG